MTYRGTLLALLAVLGILQAGSGRAQAFTVMTYNIRHGLTTTNGSNLNRVGQLIQEQNVDMVALQEIDSATVRSGGRHQPALLAHLAGMKAVFAKATFEKTGAHGLAILSRYPIIASQVVSLPSPAGGASRVLLCAYVELPAAKTIRFCTAKLDPQSVQNRHAQAATITVLLKESIQPVVWAGDLHSPAGDPLIGQMNQYWQLVGTNREQITFPELSARFDYLLIRPDGPLTFYDYRIVEEANTSDHNPVVASFRFR